MLEAGITDIVGCDRKGALSTDREDYQSGEMNATKRWYAENSNPEHVHAASPPTRSRAWTSSSASPAPGSSRPTPLAKMNDDAIVFAMANPTPEVMPEEAAPHVRIMATGRSDYPNQINNVLAFPGIFRGALDAGAPQITEAMKLAAAKGIAMAVAEADLAEDYIIPSVFNREVAPKVAEAVVEEAKRDGIARLNEETGTFAAVVDDLMRVLVTGASGLIGTGSLRGAARPRRRGRRADPRPGQGRRERSRGSPGTPGTRPWNGRRRPPSMASTGSSTWSASRSTSAGPTTAKTRIMESSPHRHPQPGRRDRGPRRRSRR